MIRYWKLFSVPKSSNTSLKVTNTSLSILTIFKYTELKFDFSNLLGKRKWFELSGGNK